MAVAAEGVSPQPGTSAATACSPGLAKRTSYQYSPEVMKPLPGKQPPSRTGFLVSFLVDARGGAMTGHRHWGMRVIIPPGALNQPTRVNCKYQVVQALASPPPLNEREALASRVIEISPAGEKFSAPVLLEIPHFASHSRAERETVVIRSDDGTTWREHISEPVEDGQIYQDVVESVVLDNSHLERIYDVLEVNRGRVVRILTSHFPKYFAVISRVREDSATIGREGGKVALLQDTKLRATFSKDALNRPIRVGLQVQTITPELVQATFGRSVEVSKMVSVEPRFRKFHQPIFVSIPLPCAARNANNIRLLCSITNEDKKAQWQDMTGTTALEINQDVVHFSTKISAIFWILVISDKQRDPASALSLASRLYEESILAPYMARISVFYRENFPRAWVTTLRIYCMTDDKAEKVICSLHGFQPLAFSGDIEITDTSTVAVKVKGNLVQVRQDPFNGEMLTVTTLRNPDIKGTFIFKAFEENSLTLLVKPKEVGTPIEGKMNFFRKLTSINDTQQVPICELNFNAAEGAIGGENKAECENGESPGGQHSEAFKDNSTPIRQIFEGKEHTEVFTKKKSGKDVDEDPYEIIERKTLADIHPRNDLDSDVCAIVSTQEEKEPMGSTKEKEPEVELEVEQEIEVYPKEDMLPTDIIAEDTSIDEKEQAEDNDNLKRFETIKIEPMNKVDQHEDLMEDSLGNDKKTLREFKKEFYVCGDGVVGKTQVPENKEECETVTEPHLSASITQFEQQIGQENINEKKDSHEIIVQSRDLDEKVSSTKTIHTEHEPSPVHQKAQKEKKKSFIQEWKNDLKDFFTIKKKSKSKPMHDSKVGSSASHQELTKSPPKAEISEEPYSSYGSPAQGSAVVDLHKGSIDGDEYKLDDLPFVSPLLPGAQRSPSVKRKPIQEDPFLKMQSKDSSQEVLLDLALEPQQFSSSMVAHMQMPLEAEKPSMNMQMPLEPPEELGVDPETNFNNPSENDVQMDLNSSQMLTENISEENLDNIKSISSEQLDENITAANLEFKTVLIANELEGNGTALKEDKISGELEDVNDSKCELITQHNDFNINEVNDHSYFTTSMITHCNIDNQEVIETPQGKDKLDYAENGIDNSSLTLPIKNDEYDNEPVSLSVENDEKASDWLKNKMLPIDEQTGRYCLPQEPKGTTENWISNWIVNEKEQPNKKENKSGFLYDVKRFFRPNKKSKLPNSNVTHSQTLRPAHQTSSTKPKVTHSLPTTPEVAPKSSKQEEGTHKKTTPEVKTSRNTTQHEPIDEHTAKSEVKTSRNTTQQEPIDEHTAKSVASSQSTSPVRTPQSEKKYSPQCSLIQYDVQKVVPGSIVDELISNMLQEPDPTQDCGMEMDCTGEIGDQGNGRNLVMDEDLPKEQQEDLQKSKRPTRSKRSSRRKTNDTVTPSKNYEEDMDKDMQNNGQVSTNRVDLNNHQLEQGEQMTSYPPPEIASTRRKKKRKTNEDIEKEQERSLLYPNEKKLLEAAGARPVLKKQDSTSSCGEKPKIVVAAPRGIPRPRRRKKDGTLEPEYSRDASVDSYSEKNIEGIIIKRPSRQSSIVEIEELNSANGVKTLTSTSSDMKGSENVNPFNEDELVVNKKTFLDEFIDNSINEAIKCSVSCERALNKESKLFESRDIGEGHTEDNIRQLKNSQRISDVTIQLQDSSENVIDSEEFNKAADSFDEIFLDQERRANTKETRNENLELESNLLGNITFLNNDYGEKAPGEIDMSEDGQHCTIDPEYLKNIDGPAHQRKGFTRFQKRQNSKDKHKSPSRDDENQGSEEEENMNLSTKLEETNVQMKRVEEAFDVLSKEDGDVENIVITQTITTKTIIEEPWVEQTASNERMTMRDISPLVQHVQQLEQIPAGSPSADSVGGSGDSEMVQQLDNSSSKTEMD